MAFDFPASPAEGATYTPAGGPTYVYNAPKWVVSGQLGWRQLQRVVPTAGPYLDLQSIPADINDLEIRFDGIVPLANSAVFILRFFNSAGSIDTGANYLWATTLSTLAAAAGAAPAVRTATSSAANVMICLTYNGGATTNVNNNAAWGISGRINVNNIRDVAKGKSAHYQTSYYGDAGDWCYCTGGSQYNVVGAITGVRLGFASTNMTASGAVTLWGSP